MTSIVIATNFDRSPHTLPLIDEAKRAGTVVLVHTVNGKPDIPGCVNVRDTSRSYPRWINRGLAETTGPTLILNDDLIMRSVAMTRMLTVLRDVDMVVLPKRGGVTPISGWCFGVNRGIRFDEAYQWWYSDDDLWERAVHEHRTIRRVGVTVRHDRAGRPRYPSEFMTAVRADRRLFASRWRDNNFSRLPG